MLTSWSIDLADPHHDVVAHGRQSPRRCPAVSASDSSMTRCATAAVRAASPSTSSRQQVREVGPDHERQRQDRNDRRQHERKEQLAVEARADLAQQRSSDASGRSRATRVKREPCRPARAGTPRPPASSVPRGGRNRSNSVGARISNRVDADAIVREVDAVAAAALLDLGPERLRVESIDSSKELAAYGPCRAPGGVDAAQAPSRRSPTSTSLAVVRALPVPPSCERKTSKYGLCDVMNGSVR